MNGFYFAFVNSTDTTWNNAFKRNDADVFSFQLNHEEGQFATLDIEIKNPKVGLLSLNRKQWAWLSYEKDQTFEPLFFGRMITVPENIESEIIKLSFLAKPSNYESQKTSVANQYKILPYYDKIWINKEKWDDPDVILETQNKLWHIDRKTHSVTLSDYNSGEDGNINIGTDFFYESLNIGYTSPPLFRIDVEADVTWSENVSGNFNIASKFPPLKTLTGIGLQDGWPDYGTDLKGGWFFGLTQGSRVDGICFPSSVFYFIDPYSRNFIGFDEYDLKISTQNVFYKAERKRKETIKFSLGSSIQNIFSDLGDEAVERISLSSDQIEKILDNSNVPIINNVYRTFFKTSRGKQSLEYLIAIAKTKLMTRARAVEISCDTKFENGLYFSCRKNISVQDERISPLPAVGKIKSYTLFANGDNGEIGCKFIIACTIGDGFSSVVSSGSNSYVQSGYSTGYQYLTGQQFEALVGGAIYDDFSNLPINDDGLDFTNYKLSQAFNSLVITNKFTEQVSKVQSEIINLYLSGTQNTASSANISSIISKYPTQITLKMNPISEGPFETTFNINISKLSIPKTLDLEV